MSIDWRARLTSDPKVCHGKVCIKGTRIMASVIVDNVAAGNTEEKIIDSYPPTTREDIRACLAYAADLARGQDLIPLAREVG